MEAPIGMYTFAVEPTRDAASATPCAWLPADAATTPAAFSCADSRAIRTYAPRILNDPVRCRFSHLRCTGPPTAWASGRDDSIGVYLATPCNSSAAALTSCTLTCSMPCIMCAPPRVPLCQRSSEANGLQGQLESGGQRSS